jgi:predicted ferric reductase
MSSSTALWYATRATGLMALVLLTATMVLGLTTTTRARARNWPGFAQQEMHRRISILAVVFLALHVLTSVLDTYVHIGWAAIVVPFASSYKTVWVALGAIGLDLLLAVAVTSHLRHKMRAGTWRAVHWLAYLSWPVALSHAFGMGTDMGQEWVIALTVACIAVVVGAGVWRVARAARRTRHALALAPGHRRPPGVPVKHLSAETRGTI